MDFQKPCPPTQRGSCGQELEGLPFSSNTLEPWASCHLLTWVREMLGADSTMPCSLPPTALDFRQGVSLGCFQNKVLRRNQVGPGVPASQRSCHPRGHRPGRQPSVNATPPLRCCGILGKSMGMQPQRPHLRNREKKAHFIG